MPKSIYIVTHGVKQLGVDPLMKPDELQKVADLRRFLPENPTTVICGTGQRHLDVAEALGLTPTQYTGVAGDPESLEIITIEGQGKKEIVRMACGRIIPLSMCSTPEDMAPAVAAKVVSCPDNAVWCSGRPTMIALGLGNAKSTTVYQVEFALLGEIERIIEINGSDNPVVLEF